MPNDKAERNEWEVKIPGALSYLLELQPTLDEPVKGLKEWEPANRSHMIGLIYYSFRIMSGIGMFFAALMIVSVNYKTATISTWTTLVGAVFITVTTPILSGQARALLFTAPMVYIFGLIPLLGGVQVWLLLQSLKNREETTPIIWTFLLLALSFIGLGFLIFPNIIPPSVTIYEAAAAPSSCVLTK